MEEVGPPNTGASPSGLLWVDPPIPNPDRGSSPRFRTFYGSFTKVCPLGPVLPPLVCPRKPQCVFVRTGLLTMSCSLEQEKTTQAVHKSGGFGSDLAHDAGVGPTSTLRLQDGRRLSLGQFVELQPAPGEALPMVAQLQALWSERPADGQERMLARVRRFYRPQVLLAPVL